VCDVTVVVVFPDDVCYFNKTLDHVIFLGYGLPVYYITGISRLHFWCIFSFWPSLSVWLGLV
jgi:hypothetical protein